MEQADWQNASSNVQDAPLQAAIQDGVITFLHAADAAPHMLPQEVADGQTQQRAGTSASDADNAIAGSRENLSPNAAASIDDVSCLDLD